jgi:hypothetical protein
MTPTSLFIILIFGIVGIYLSNPRAAKNFIFAVIPKFRREFVVVWFIKKASRKPLKFYVIPDETGYGKIENGKYNLEKENALPDEEIFNGRLHFLVEEGNPIPVKAKIQEITKNKVLFVHKGKLYFKGAQGYELSDPDKDKLRTWAFSIQRALVTTWYKVLYAEVRQWAFIIAVIAFGVMVIVSLYEYQTIQNTNLMVNTIYQHTIIENGSVLIKQGVTP